VAFILPFRVTNPCPRFYATRVKSQAPPYGDRRSPHKRPAAFFVADGEYTEAEGDATIGFELTRRKRARCGGLAAVWPLRCGRCGVPQIWLFERFTCPDFSVDGN
jgi:hypothetical protein